MKIVTIDEIDTEFYIRIGDVILILSADELYTLRDRIYESTED